jgi:DNA polymerase-3 subunit epsilon
MRREIVLDTETTGIDPRQGHRVIEIACIELDDRLPTGRHFHRYVNPDRAIDADAQRVHGISNA